MMFGSFLTFGGPPPYEPPSEELRERALNMLKHTALFGNTSRRLVVDLVDKYGVRPVGRDLSPLVIENIEPAILVVLEGTLTVTDGALRRILRPGAYLRHDPLFTGVEWVHSRMEASSEGDETVRIFLLDATEIFTVSPLVWNAVNPVVLAQLESALS